MAAVLQAGHSPKIEFRRKATSSPWLTSAVDRGFFGQGKLPFKNIGRSENYGHLFFFSLSLSLRTVVCAYMRLHTSNYRRVRKHAHRGQSANLPPPNFADPRPVSSRPAPTTFRPASLKPPRSGRIANKIQLACETRRAVLKSPCNVNPGAAFAVELNHPKRRRDASGLLRAFRGRILNFATVRSRFSMASGWQQA